MQGLNRRRLLTALSVAAATSVGLPVSLLAQPMRFREGLHYTLLPEDNALGRQQRTLDSPLVTEVFWYGCPSCYAFDPLLNQWVADMAGLLSFQRSPIVWDRATREHARLFHAAEALGILEEAHPRIFAEIHQRGNRLLDAASQQAFLAGAGVGAEEAGKALQSFAVDSELRKAEALQGVIKTPSIPAMVVAGRYLVAISDAVDSHTAMLEVVDFLLETA